MYFAGVYSAVEALKLDSLRMFLRTNAAAEFKLLKNKKARKEGTPLIRWVNRHLAKASDEVRSPLRHNVPTLAYFTSSTP